MSPTLRSPLLLFCLTPLALFAQVNAGELTGVVHTSVLEQIQTVLNLPASPTSEDSTSVDLDGDGVLDLQFMAAMRSYPDNTNAQNGVTMQHAGVELALEEPGGSALKRFDAGDIIDASAQWRPFGAVAGNSVVMGSLSYGFGGGLQTVGNDWLVNGSQETHGYIGVRLVSDAGTRYGWVGLFSFIQPNYAWLQINYTGIQETPTTVDDVSPLDHITVRLMAEGHVLLQGSLEDVKSISVYDASGRMVRQVVGAISNVIDLSGEAPGVHVLRIIGREEARSFKLAW